VIAAAACLSAAGLVGREAAAWRTRDN
jgi:hypothetical protein